MTYLNSRMPNRVFFSKRYVRLRFFLTMLILLTPYTFADSDITLTQPITAYNRSPLLSSFLIMPNPQRQNAEPDTWALSVEADLSNYLSYYDTGKETYYTDGETLFVTSTLSYTLKNTLQLSAELPWIHHGGGVLDRAIYNYHDMLSLPQNGRIENVNDRLDIQYRYENQLLVNLKQTSSGIGDIRLHLEHAGDANETLRLSIKLPTGDADELTGTGSSDIAMSYLSANPSWFSERTWLKDVPLTLWYNAALSLLGEHELLTSLERNPLVISGQLGSAWQLNRHHQLKLQLDGHSPLYESDVRELGWAPLIASFAYEYHVNKAQRFNARISEDLRPRVTPDVSLAIQFVHGF